MALLRIFKTILILAIVGFTALLAYGYGRNHPEDLPWTRLDLSQPTGTFTGRKLAALDDDFRKCRTLLAEAGVRFTALPARSEAPQCGYDNVVRLGGGGSLGLRYQPSSLGISCPVAAGLVMWEWNVVQPAAIRHFGKPVAAIEHFGSYSCRRLYGRSAGGWSEHSHANAVDIAAFRLKGGGRISVARDWTAKNGRSAEAKFLHEVRDGACPLFATVLSPDYNRAHHDHLHLDQANRGSLGWRACR